METLRRRTQGAWSNFNAAEFVVNRRFKGGLTFLASYVYASYLDIVSYGAEGGTGPRDPENFALSYGPSDHNVRHRFVASYIWQFPKVQQFHGVTSAVLNGWSIQGIGTVQTGAPYSINSNQDTAARAIGNDTADWLPVNRHRSPTDRDTSTSTRRPFKMLRPTLSGTLDVTSRRGRAW